MSKNFDAKKQTISVFRVNKHIDVKREGEEKSRYLRKGGTFILVHPIGWTPLQTDAFTISEKLLWIIADEVSTQQPSMLRHKTVIQGFLSDSQKVPLEGTLLPEKSAAFLGFTPEGHYLNGLDIVGCRNDIKVKAGNLYLKKDQHLKVLKKVRKGDVMYYNLGYRDERGHYISFSLPYQVLKEFYYVKVAQQVPISSAGPFGISIENNPSTPREMLLHITNPTDSKKGAYKIKSSDLLGAIDFENPGIRAHIEKRLYNAVAQEAHLWKPFEREMLREFPPTVEDAMEFAGLLGGLETFATYLRYLYASMSKVV